MNEPVGIKIPNESNFHLLPERTCHWARQRQRDMILTGTEEND